MPVLSSAHPMPAFCPSYALSYLNHRNYKKGSFISVLSKQQEIEQNKMLGEH